MAMHYSRQKINRELTRDDLGQLSDHEAWEIFRKSRFGEDERFACPECTFVDKHWFIKTRKQWTCKHCRHRFSVTSGTAFNNRKLAFRKLLCIVFRFLTDLQGVNANNLLSDVGITYKTAFQNVSKIREVLYQSMDMTPLTGIVHIDCMHICGKPRRSNIRKASDSALVNNKLRTRKDSIVPDKSTHPEPWNIEKLKNRRIVLALSQLALTDDGSYGSDRTIAFILKRETASLILPLIKKHVARNAIIMSDCGGAFNQIEPLLGIKHFSVNHSKRYQDEFGVNNNQAESFFSRIRRAEYGTYNAVGRAYLAFYVAEFGYRNDSKYFGIRARFDSLLSKILRSEPSKFFSGYNQGHRAKFEYAYD